MYNSEDLSQSNSVFPSSLQTKSREPLREQLGCRKPIQKLCDEEDSRLGNNLPISIRSLYRNPPIISKSQKQFTLKTTIKTIDDLRNFDTKALIDSGCELLAIDKKWANEKQLNLKPLPNPIRVYNADNSENTAGMATHYFSGRMKIGNHEETFDAIVTNLERDYPIFLGIRWLEIHNPEIDWTNKTLDFTRCPKQCEIIGPSRIRRTTIEEIPEDDLSPTPNYFEEYKDVFIEGNFDELPEHREEYDYQINFKEDAKPFTSKVYPLTQEELQELRKWLDENLRSGKYRPSKSPFASPFFYKYDKDKLRPIVDYRKLNEQTIKEQFPLPLIKVVIEALQGAQYFTKMDVRWGFNNIRIREGDEEKAAFITPEGLFEPLVMQFGLCNAPATFQRFMKTILKEELETGKVLVYIDDIIVHTRTRKENRELTRRVIEKLKKNHLYLKPAKCSFEKEEVEYLGMIVGRNTIKPSGNRLNAIKSWPTPTNKKALQQFLGLMNYYRRFIQSYASIVHPLYSLTGKNPWEWTADHQKAFDKIREVFQSDQILHMPQDEGKFIVDVDASGFATGAVLSQVQDGKNVLIDMDSAQMNSAERNYPIYDREMLGIIRALTKWRHHLLGAKEPFEIRCDHSNLAYYRSPQKLTRRQARWTAEIQPYQFIFTFVPGKQNSRADALSRRPDYEKGEHDNEDITVFPDTKFRALRTKKSKKPKLKEQILRYSNLIEKEVEEERLNPSSYWFQTDDGIWYFKHQIYIPNHSPLRDHILSLHHNTPSAGHPGPEPMTNLIARRYYWPSLKDDVKLYCQTCETCQKSKTKTGKIPAPIYPFKSADGPWQIISWDLIGPLPESRGYNAILVIVDKFTKRLTLEPTTTELSSQGAAKILIERIYRNHGLPEKIISDQGPQFVSKFMKEVYRLLRIEGNPSTAYHPQTDGQTKCLNQEVEKYLRIFVNNRQDDWADWLSLAEFAQNNKITSATGFSPFFLDLGRHPREGFDIDAPMSTAPRGEEFIKQLQEIRELAKSALEKTADKMSKSYDRHRTPSTPYQPGDKVLLNRRNITTPRNQKLDDKYFGPFEVIESIGPTTYKLKLPPTWRIKDTFNESLLRPYFPPLFPSQKSHSRPPPVSVDNQEEYEVEEILDTRYSTRRKKQEYLVKWLGYPHEDNTWEPAENLTNAQKSIDTFLEHYDTLA